MQGMEGDGAGWEKGPEEGGGAVEERFFAPRSLGGTAER